MSEQVETSTFESNVSRVTGRAPLILGLFFGGIMLVQGSWIWSGFGVRYFPDSLSFLEFGRQLLDFSANPSLGHRSLPYPLTSALLGASTDVTRLIFAQFTLAAMSVGILILVLARSNRIAAIFVGIGLCADHTWAFSNLAVLLEGMLATTQVFTLALLCNDFQRGSRTTFWRLFLTGIAFGSRSRGGRRR